VKLRRDLQKPREAGGKVGLGVYALHSAVPCRRRPGAQETPSGASAQDALTARPFLGMDDP
jgi:hypothetical protein